MVPRVQTLWQTNFTCNRPKCFESQSVSMTLLLPATLLFSSNLSENTQWLIHQQCINRIVNFQSDHDVFHSDHNVLILHPFSSSPECLETNPVEISISNFPSILLSHYPATLKLCVIFFVELYLQTNPLACIFAFHDMSTLSDTGIPSLLRLILTSRFHVCRSAFHRIF